jgi:hypothetical protein
MHHTLVHHGGGTDLAALHDALGCAATAAVQAFRGDGDSASLSLTEAHAAANEAFGSGSPGVDALNVVFAAIAQAAAASPPCPHDKTAGLGVRAPRPASDLSRSNRERTQP